ncbi:MAG: transcriptional regulator with XRE-family HTH domain [Cocleimonas sp.]|jgi:transcriptional regulator with XRE-family HTH domain
MPLKNTIVANQTLSQNPHEIENKKEKKLELAVGRQVQLYRKQLGLTITELAEAAGISMGMMSKIENGMTSPSLTTLQQLSSALGVPISDFFNRFEQEHEAVFVSAGEGIEIERRGSRAGHQYQLLGHTNRGNNNVVVEPYLVTLTEKTDLFPDFQHTGVEFIYMIEGEMIYHHDGNNYILKAGDSLYFDAEGTHGPKKLIELPVKFVSTISYAIKDSSN